MLQEFRSRCGGKGGRDQKEVREGEMRVRRPYGYDGDGRLGIEEEEMEEVRGMRKERDFGKRFGGWERGF